MGQNETWEKLRLMFIILCVYLHMQHISKNMYVNVCVCLCHYALGDPSLSPDLRICNILMIYKYYYILLYSILYTIIILYILLY